VLTHPVPPLLDGSVSFSLYRWSLPYWSTLCAALAHAQAVLRARMGVTLLGAVRRPSR